MSWIGSNFPFMSCKRTYEWSLTSFPRTFLLPLRSFLRATHALITSPDILDASAESNACISSPRSLPSKAQKMLMPEDWPGGLGAVGFDWCIKWRAYSKAVTVFIVMKRDGRIVIIIVQSIPSIYIPPKAYVKCRNCLWFSTSGQQSSKSNMGSKAKG